MGNLRPTRRVGATGEGGGPGLGVLWFGQIARSSSAATAQIDRQLP